MNKITFLLLLVLCIPSKSYAKGVEIEFGSGLLLVELPSYTKVINKSQEGFIATFDGKGEYVIEMSRIPSKGKRKADGFGAFAVKRMAEQQGQVAKSVGEKAILVERIIETPTKRTQHFSIGVGGSVVTMTLTLPLLSQASDAFNKRINSVVNAAITSLLEKGV